MRWALLFFLASLTASAEELNVAPGSDVSFDAHTTFHDFAGRSSSVSGRMTLEGGHLRSANVAVATGSLQTGEAGRDRDMAGAKYLDVAHHPDIAFEASSFDGGPVVPGQSGNGSLHGAFAIRGQRKALTVAVAYRWEGSSLVVTGDVPLDIRDFGMSPPTVALVQRMDAKVIVHFRLVFARADR